LYLFSKQSAYWRHVCFQIDVALPPSQVSANPASANPTEFKKQVFQQARILICICFQSKALIGVTYASR
jgi:hypothetical protein